MKLLPFSIELEKFIKKNSSLHDFSKFSPKSKQFLLEIYRQMYLIYEKINISNISNIISETPHIQNPDIEYIPKEIQTIIENQTISIKSYRFHTKHRNIHVYFHFYSQSQIDQVQEYLTYIMMWLLIAENYACHECSRNMNIYIYLTNHLKQLPLHNDNRRTISTSISNIDRIHVNTGFTTSCQHTTNMTIFREEEWLKVFIHETFHNLGLDFLKSNNNSIANKLILQIFPIKTQDIRIYESYVEMFSEVLYLQFLIFFSTIHKKNSQSMLRKLENMMIMESYFSLFQCVKVLHFHQNMKYTDLYDTSNGSSQFKREQYMEKTSIFSYFVMKSLLYFHKNEFLEWCIENNTNTIQFTKTRTNVEKYCHLIYRIHKDPLFLQEIANMEQVLQNIRRKIYKTTLRMTMYSI